VSSKLVGGSRENLALEAKDDIFSERCNLCSKIFSKSSYIVPIICFTLQIVFLILIRKGK
jgi:hypothetical protein